MKILITGSVGFIGYHTSVRLLGEGHEVFGIDSLNEYYDPVLKHKRNELLSKFEKYHFFELDISNYEKLLKKVEEIKPEVIIHLAAQAGVRYSLTNPWAYEQANVLGTINIFEVARKQGIKRVIFASSSSVYGSNISIPFKESDKTDSPVSLYAATKKSTEVLAKTYNHLYGIETAGLRFFTVYGEWYRPDMALFTFSKLILNGQPIKLFNNGKMKRDFTFVSDIVDGICGVTFKKDLKYEIYNLGGENPVELEYVVSLLEKGLGQTAQKEYLPMQPGDVEVTYADITKAKQEIGYNPKVRIEEGVEKFAKWFLENKEFLLGLK